MTRVNELYRLLNNHVVPGIELNDKKSLDVEKIREQITHMGSKR
jgi:hypothetical protein